MLKRIVALLVSLVFMVSLSEVSSAREEFSYANIKQVIATHLYLDLTVNFNNKTLKGYAEYDIKRLTPTADPFIVDTSDLVISKVEVLDKSWHETTFELAKKDQLLGSKLTIQMPQKVRKVRIYYITSPRAFGLQWLTPAQTAGKKYPYLYTESEPTHTRSWIPIQDTPALRLSYNARIKTPKNLFAVMSAHNNPNSPRNGVYTFVMPHKIPSYLIALGVGDLHFKAMSKNTGVYAEKYILDAAVWEFSDTSKMMDAVEKLYGPYRWGRYDILMMPPSYPMGGMENPMLSFITPTVVAGDKSLVDLIAHELSHSWSGNLVTNADWDDLWLNEGMTTYVENRVMEAVYSRKRAVMEQVLAIEGLRREMKTMAIKDTSLHANLKDRDPDAAFTGIPYVKGQMFLMYLEQKYGRNVFDAFLKGYFNAHAFQNMTSAKFIRYLKAQLMDKYPGKVTMKKINEWVYGTGLPVDAPNPVSKILMKVKQYQQQWLADKILLKDIPAKHWFVNQWLYFITNLPQGLSAQKMAKLDKAYGLTKSRNNEIADAWLLQSLKHHYMAVLPRLRTFLPSIGRLKLIKPLYKQLATTAKGLKTARKIYLPARPGYHPSAQKILDKMLGYTN